MSRRSKVLTVLALLLAVVVVTPHTTSFLLLLATRILILAILAMSLDLLLGFTGIASLGHAAFLGFGAYMTAILAVRYHFGLGWDFWLVVLFGCLLGAATAAVFGLFALRARGVYFLMITLALSQCVWGLAYRWDTLTGGDNGLNLPGRPVFGAIRLGNATTYFYLVFVFFALSLLALYLLVESPFGKSLVGIREHEVRMRILGYNTWLHKYIVFIVSGAFGGLAGVLWAHVSSEVSPEDVTLATSVDALLMVVLGGPGTLFGGVLGAAIVVFLREYLSTLVPWWQYVLGGMYVLAIIYLPDGLLSIFRPRRQAVSAGTAPAQALAPPSGRGEQLKINEGGIE
jgi:branched-chain amino acid transport system permease protein